VAIAAPFPVFRTVHQLTLHWIAVNIFQFFDELFVVGFVAVVIALLPEGSGDVSHCPELLAALCGGNLQ
jgi:hypothetical protein